MDTGAQGRKRRPVDRVALRVRVTAWSMQSKQLASVSGSG
jgi:hypothetical protein